MTRQSIHNNKIINNANITNNPNHQNQLRNITNMTQNFDPLQNINRSIITTTTNKTQKQNNVKINKRKQKKNNRPHHPNGLLNNKDSKSILLKHLTLQKVEEQEQNTNSLLVCENNQKKPEILLKTYVKLDNYDATQKDFNDNVKVQQEMFFEKIESLLLDEDDQPEEALDEKEYKDTVLLIESLKGHTNDLYKTIRQRDNEIIVLWADSAKVKDIFRAIQVNEEYEVTYKFYGTCPNGAFNDSVNIYKCQYIKILKHQ